MEIFMKKKLLCFVITLLLVFSMSSCLLFDDVNDLYFGDNYSSGNKGNTTINVNGGDTNNITINTPESAEVISANKALLSAVSVYCNFKRSSYGFVTNEVTGAGSGVIVSESGHIITNNHVIEGASNINVTLYDGSSYPAKLIATDERTDLAVIKIEADGVEYAGQKEAAANSAIAESLTEAVLKYYYIQQWDGKLPETYVGSEDVSTIINSATGNK
jgi:S1-C subfamily serine protease